MGTIIAVAYAVTKRGINTWRSVIEVLTKTSLEGLGLFEPHIFVGAQNLMLQLPLGVLPAGTNQTI